MKHYDIIIIGAGAAGIGFGAALKHFGIDSFVILERGEIGESFLNWPTDTRFITPSFTTNGFGFPDINAIVPNTSPAYSFEKEHISGEEYADYLAAVAQNYELPIHEHTEVTHVEKEQDVFVVSTVDTCYQAKYVIFAVGEFQRPNRLGIEGGELGIHYGEVADFAWGSGTEYVVIGGNESGVDTLVNLVEAGNSVTLYTSSFGQSERVPDPSIALSPITKTRLRNAIEKYGNQITIREGMRLMGIERDESGFTLSFQDGEIARTPHQPVLATGFLSEVHQFESPLFEYNEDCIPLVNKYDESTVYENAFLIGPSVRQQQVIFCYIYKFRQRFAYIIHQIAQREGWEVSEDALSFYKMNQMYLDDLACCAVECDC
ncbi:MAG: NAD(P)-binding domain-containing protein [Aerococcaceae bacterium]|nr:NAD(P)-binding domain-containing protein [Aerococcaceae bacterium]